MRIKRRDPAAERLKDPVKKSFVFDVEKEAWDEFHSRIKNKSKWVEEKILEEISQPFEKNLQDIDVRTLADKVFNSMKQGEIKSDTGSNTGQ